MTNFKNKFSKFISTTRGKAIVCSVCVALVLSVGGVSVASATGWYERAQNASNQVLTDMLNDGNLTAEEVQELKDSEVLGEEMVDPNTGETVVLTQNEDGTITKTVVRDADGNDTGATVPENHENAPAVDSHTHNWVPQYGTRMVTVQTGTQQVCVQGAYDEPVYTTVKHGCTHCSICGAVLQRDNTTVEDKYRHMISNHPETGGGGGTYASIEYEQVQTGTIHHDAVYETQPVYGQVEETYIVCYKCSGCGATQ